MFERLTHRSKYGIAYTKIAANESNMVDVGECYTGRIIDRLAAYEDSGLSPEEVQELKVSVKICEDCWNHAQAKADGLKCFDFSRTAEWNAAPLEGQKITTKFRIKQNPNPKPPKGE